MIVFKRWLPNPGDLFAKVRPLVDYSDGNRASGWVDEPWIGPILDDLEQLIGVRFTVVAFQGYKDGDAACHWHADQNFDVQAILSLGATRSFGLRHGEVADFERLEAGDLLFMPSGLQDEWEHCVPAEPDVTGERISLVFRTNKEQ